MVLVIEKGNRLKLIINIIVLAISLFGITKTDYNFDKTSFFERMMIDSIGPMQRSVTYVKVKFSSFFDNYLLNVDASKKNIGLKKDIGELEKKIFEYEELVAENFRIKKLLQFNVKKSDKKILAQIVSWDSSSSFKTLRINKGLVDGVKLQSVVVTMDGLVGYIFRLTDHFADVLTILNPNNRVDSILKQTRSYGIIEGNVNGTCLMKYVKRTESVNINDQVLTSGLGNIYPKGIKVGRVSKIEKESYGITQYIEIIPSVDFDGLEEIIVLSRADKKSKQLEWDALDNTKL